MSCLVKIPNLQETGQYAEPHHLIDFQGEKNSHVCNDECQEEKRTLTENYCKEDGNINNQFRIQFSTSFSCQKWTWGATFYQGHIQHDSNTTTTTSLLDYLKHFESLSHCHEVMALEVNILSLGQQVTLAHKTAEQYKKQLIVVQLIHLICIVRYTKRIKESWVCSNQGYM